MKSKTKSNGKKIAFASLTMLLSSIVIVPTVYAISVGSAYASDAGSAGTTRIVSSSSQTASSMAVRSDYVNVVKNGIYFRSITVEKFYGLDSRDELPDSYTGSIEPRVHPNWYSKYKDGSVYINGLKVVEQEKDVISGSTVLGTISKSGAYNIVFVYKEKVLDNFKIYLDLSSSESPVQKHKKFFYEYYNNSDDLRQNIIDTAFDKPLGYISKEVALNLSSDSPLSRQLNAGWEYLESIKEKTNSSANKRYSFSESKLKEYTVEISFTSNKTKYSITVESSFLKENQLVTYKCNYDDTGNLANTKNGNSRCPIVLDVAQSNSGKSKMLDCLENDDLGPGIVISSFLDGTEYSNSRYQRDMALSITQGAETFDIVSPNGKYNWDITAKGSISPIYTVSIDAERGLCNHLDYTGMKAALLSSSGQYYSLTSGDGSTGGVAIKVKMFAADYDTNEICLNEKCSIYSIYSDLYIYNHMKAPQTGWSFGFSYDDGNETTEHFGGNNEKQSRTIDPIPYGIESYDCSCKLLDGISFYYQAQLNSEECGYGGLVKSPYFLHKDANAVISNYTNVSYKVDGGSEGDALFKPGVHSVTYRDNVNNKSIVDSVYINDRNAPIVFPKYDKLQIPNSERTSFISGGWSKYFDIVDDDPNVIASVLSVNFDFAADSSGGSGNIEFKVSDKKNEAVYSFKVYFYDQNKISWSDKYWFPFCYAYGHFWRALFGAESW